MKDLDKLGNELKKSGKSEALMKLAESPDGKAVGRLVDAESVRKAAKSGDMAALQDILRGVLSTDEGKRLAEGLRKAMQ
ncbi:MAG: hypothetical protein MR653_07390 [Clostridiales bacterium]|nr:hypothetical protein [Clostridiales bacterium]MDY4144460.1 hypothetical protein [Oscillospiraceae bacterium]